MPWRSERVCVCLKFRVLCHVCRQQLTHQIGLDAGKHSERVHREKDQRLAELEVLTAPTHTHNTNTRTHTTLIHTHNTNTHTHTHWQAQRKRQEEEIAHLTELKRLGVDITTLLVARHPKPDQVCRDTHTHTQTCQTNSLSLSLPIYLGCEGHHTRQWRRTHTRSPLKSPSKISRVDRYIFLCRTCQIFRNIKIFDFWCLYK